MYRHLHLAALLLAAPLPTLAAPTNDHFVNSHQLGNTVPATHFTSTADATLETSEPDPIGAGGASVWYTWTAPSSGWHAVSTLGSTYDTILYVFTGETLGTLQLTSRSDDVAPSEYQSLARFQTTASTTYHIAVHGYAADTGDIFFDIDAIPTPLHLDSLSVATPPGDLASTDSSITLHIGVTSPDGLSDGSVGLFTPTTPTAGIPGISFATFTAADRIAGDHLAGTYAVNVPLPRYGAPGTWPLDIQLADTTSETARYGHPSAGDIFPPNITTTSVTVTNTGPADTTPPTLTSLTFTPATIDVTSSPQTLTLSLEITDPLSGTDVVAIDLLDPLGAFYDSIILTPADITSGTTNTGTFTTTLQLPQFIEPGTYTIDPSPPLDVIDRTGNRRSYGPAHTPFPAGTTTGFTVLNTAGTDTTPPALTSATITPANADIGPAPVTLTATFTATDDLSGITSGTVALELPTGELHSTPFDATHRTAGTPTNGTYNVPLTLSAPTTAPGTYPLVIGLRDSAAYTSAYGGTFGDLIPTGGNHSVTVTDSGPAPDTTPYDLWIATYPQLTGPDADPDADPDHDGLTNLEELPFNLDPTRDSSPAGPDPNRNNAPTLTKTPTTISLTYTLAPANLTAYNHHPITVTPQASPDLKTPTAVTPTDLGENRYRATITTTGTGNHLNLKITTSP